MLGFCKLTDQHLAQSSQVTAKQLANIGPQMHIHTLMHVTSLVCNWNTFVTALWFALNSNKSMDQARAVCLMVWQASSRTLLWIHACCQCLDKMIWLRLTYNYCEPSFSLFGLSHHQRHTMMHFTVNIYIYWLLPSLCKVNMLDSNWKAGASVCSHERSQ